MRQPIMLLAAGTLLSVSGGSLSPVYAASAHASSVSREVVKLDAMGGSRNVATAVFVYDHKKNLTTVTLTASRLRPKSVHPAAVQLGRCTTFKGPIVHAFTTLRVGTKGNATATMSFRGPISHDKWYVAILQGPTLKSKNGIKLLACRNVS